MLLQAGTRLGPYEVLAPIGAGGMGEVYRARDTKLNRDVALKILPHNFADDPDRLARFTREAQLLASLNHQNIAHVHGVEDSAGLHALVMELVEGEDLAQRIARGPLPMDEAIPIAKQIAEALESAHDQGIIHRDLKPANIKVRADGTVKVLDFGLAKALHGSAETAPMGSALSLSPTLTSPVAMTAMGFIIGTAAYMSPEQAKGKVVDKRADIWAFGAVLCEMLTGRPLFDGETVTEVLAAVMMRAPDLTGLPAALPIEVRRLIDRCLEKDPKLRLRDIGEARLVLAAPDSSLRPATTPTSQRASSNSAATRWLSVLAAVLVIALAVTGWLLWRATNTRPTGSVTRFDVQPPDKATLLLAARPNVALSPDGSKLVFAASAEGVQRLYVRTRDAVEPRAIPGTDGASNPIFSPDGTEVAFFASASLQKARLDGSVVKIVDGGAIDASISDMDPRGATWLPDGTIVYSPVAAGPLYRVPSAGGKPEALTHLVEASNERTHRWPFALPGGKAVLFTVGTLATPDNYDEATIEAVEVATGVRHVVMRGAASARYVPTGHLLFMRGSVLSAVRFDPERFTVSGPPVRVAEGVNGDTTTGAAHLSVADDGTLAYMPGSSQAGVNQLMWVDRQNATTSLQLPSGLFFDPQISPDGTRAVAVWETVASGNGGDVWVTDLGRKTFTRLSFSGGATTPMWSPDSRTIYYAYLDPGGRKSEVMRLPADGSRRAETLVTIDSLVYLTSVSRDGTYATVTYRQRAAGAGRDNVMKVMLEKDGKVEPLVATPSDEFGGALSPDGRFLAYQSDESGRYEIYVRGLADGSRTQVSTTGGEEPHWSMDGRELFYRNDTKFMSVAIENQPAFVPKSPAMVFDGVFNFRSDSGVSFAVDSKNNRFLMIRPVGDNNGASQIRIVLNWFDELRRLMAGSR